MPIRTSNGYKKIKDTPLVLSKEAVDMLVLLDSCKQYRMNPDKRVKAGIYFRVYVNHSGAGKEIVRVNNFVRNKDKRHTTSHPRYGCSFVKGRHTPDVSYEYYHDDLCRSGAAFKHNAKTKAMLERFVAFAAKDPVMAELMLFRRSGMTHYRWLCIQDEMNADLSWAVDYDLFLSKHLSV